MFEDWEDKAELAASGAVKEQDKAMVEGMQRTREWFKARLGKWTGSNIHKLMVAADIKKSTFGNGAITYILQIINERTMTDEAIEAYVDDMMAKEFKQTKWGIENEDKAIVKFEKRSGLKVADTRFRENEARPYFGGSTDGLVSDGNPAEIKNPFDGIKHLKNREMCLSGGMPENSEYYAQCQSHMENTKGSIKTHFVSYDLRQKAPRNYVHIEVDRNEEYIDLMLKRIDMAEYIARHFINNDTSIHASIAAVKHLEEIEL